MPSVDHLLIMTLQELAKSLHNCQQCKLAKLGRTQVVFGVGNPHASIMFVGERPDSTKTKRASRLWVRRENS